MNFDTRTPPNNRDAEQAVIGSMLRDNSVIPDVTLILPPAQAEELFYDHSLAILYGHVVKLNDEKKKVDLVLLAQSLHDSGTTEEVGGHARIAAIYDETPTAANGIYYAEIVAEHASRRRYLSVGSKIVAESYNPCEPGSLPAFTETLILEAANKHSGSKTDFLRKEYFAIADALDRPEPKQPGYSTGIPAIDVMFSLEPGTLTTIGARTSIGKSIMLAQFAHNLADQQLPTLLISLEMRRQELAERLMSLRSGVRFTTLRGVSLADESESAKAFEATNELYNLPLLVNCEPQNIASIKAEARRAKMRHGLKALAIDYVQLIESERSKGETRAEEIGKITKALKRLALDLDIAVIIASQLSRESETQKEPYLKDLRESGSIEQDSDSVILLWTDDNDTDPDRVRGKVAKQRNGPKAHFELTRSAAFMRFDPYIHRPSWVKKSSN